MALSQRTARFASLDPGAVWDLGMVTVFSAYAISRFLLVTTSFRAFLQYPLLVLELPSLTRTGIALTALVSIGYARYRRLQVLPLLDALAPCVALLWIFASAGWVADGTRDGMPAAVPWAVGSGLGRVHPLEIYRLVAALTLCGFLLAAPRLRQRAGHTAWWGLLLGGLALFAVDFFRLPDELFSDAWLDQGQWIGVAMMAVGGGMLAAGVGNRDAKDAQGRVDAV